MSKRIDIDIPKNHSFSVHDSGKIYISTFPGCDSFMSCWAMQGAFDKYSADGVAEIFRWNHDYTKNRELRIIIPTFPSYELLNYMQTIPHEKGYITFAKISEMVHFYILRENRLGTGLYINRIDRKAGVTSWDILLKRDDPHIYVAVEN